MKPYDSDDKWREARYTVYEAGRKLGEPFRRKTKSKRLHTAKTGTYIFAYGILALPILYFFVFYLYVNFNSIALAFKDSLTDRFTLDNFKYVIGEVTRAGTSMFTVMKNTMLFWLLGWVLMPVNIIVSFILYKQLWGYKVFQTIFYLPTIISGVVWMTAYKNFLLPDGPFCQIMLALGIFQKGAVPELLQNSQYALGAVMMSSVWLGVPGGMLIYCGSLCRIPYEVIEAAKLDGVGFWREIRHITIPFLGPLLATQILLHCISLLSASGNVLLLTEGRYGTSTLNYWLYDQVVVNDEINVPSAAGLLMTLLTLPIVIVSRLLTSKIEDIEY